MRGQCMLIDSGGGDHKHLFTIVIDPMVVPNMGSMPIVILIGFTSVRSQVPYDDSCVVQAGEHPFIKHESYLNYRHARIERAQHIEAMLAQGVFIQKEPCPEQLLEKVIQGALQSNRISREIKEIIRSALDK